VRFALIAGLTLCGCAGILGIEDRVLDASVAPDDDGGTDAGVIGCTTHAQCAAPDASMVCIVDEHRCAELRSDDCPTITGTIENGSVVVASLLSTKGTQANTNLPRQNSAALAVEEINNYGGVPIGGARRKVVLISCDESTNLTRVSNHLIDDLKVPAIMGPNLSQDVIDLTNRRTAASGTLLMTPTAVASSITDLADHNLTWRNVPSDVQRAPLMVQQINALEAQLKAARSVSSIKLAIIWRNDALGLGTFNTLSTMTLNGKPLSEASNAALVRIDGYDAKVADQSALVSKYIAFQPDIVAAIGSAEIVTRIMQPIEAGWGAGPRPVYLMIDSGKVPELISAVTSNDDFRQRVRGTGVTPTDRSKPVYATFALNYKARYGDFPDISGMAAAYDGLYAFAFAMAAQGTKPLTGSTLALGLRSLTGGLTEVKVGPTEVTKAFTELEKGNAISVVGTLGPFEWDANGDALGSLIEMWCIGKTGSTIAYGSSGITYNTKTQTTAGTYTQCP
jgi:ABC-type branched-subunit amino acid transport system substrate-binding protein